MKKWSRRACRITSGFLLAATVGYYSFVFAFRSRIPPENWEDQLRAGNCLIGGTVGILLNAVFYDQIEAWKARRREKLKGSVWGLDVTRWFRRK